MRFLAWKYVTSWRFLILGHQLVVSYRAVSYNRILRVFLLHVKKAIHKSYTEPPFERMRRVRPHPLKSGNGCAVPVLRTQSLSWVYPSSKKNAIFVANASKSLFSPDFFIHMYFWEAKTVENTLKLTIFEDLVLKNCILGVPLPQSCTRPVKAPTAPL